MAARDRLTVLVSGASGMIGVALRRRLSDAGHETLRLVRRPPEREDEIRWDPASGSLEPGLMERVDAVVDLSGAPLDRLPWTPRYRTEILASRLRATRTIVDAMRASDRPPAVLVNASAVGYYGNRPGVALTDEADRGDGFLADTVDRWEQEARRAPEQTRVVTIRTGLVVGPGGAMRPLVRAARAGLAGPIGTGRQHWPWIGLHDEAEAILHLVATSSLDGAVNLAGPVPATAGELVAAIARRLRRPYGVPLPAPLVSLALGQAGRELLLADQLVVPERLTGDGFAFRDRTVTDAVASALKPR